jgi:hypothetical protein
MIVETLEQLPRKDRTMRTENVNTPGKHGSRVTAEKYRVMSEAILGALRSDGEGITWEELVQRIAPLVPGSLFPHMGSVRWYSKAVQLDLEARRLIERLPGSKPLRFRKLG